MSVRKARFLFFLHFIIKKNNPFWKKFNCYWFCTFHMVKIGFMVNWHAPTTYCVLALHPPVILLYYIISPLHQAHPGSHINCSSVFFRISVLFSAYSLYLLEEAWWGIIHLQLTATSLAPCWSPWERKQSLTTQEHIPPQHRGDTAI